MTDAQTLWLDPALPLSLAEGEVHLWRIPLDLSPRAAERMRSLLPPEETSRMERYKFEQDRLHFIAAHGAMRRILGIYQRQDPAGLQFTYDERSKPSLAALTPGPGGHLSFNLSHAHSLALLGVGRGRPLGVDIEYTLRRVDFALVAARFFAPNEQAALERLPNVQRREAFFNCWTRKEAYLKARGTGLARPLDRFEVSLVPGEPARLLKDQNDPEAPLSWSLREFEVAPGYVGALAIEGPLPRVACWQFSADAEHL